MLTLITKNGGELTSDVFAALMERHLTDGVLFGCDCSAVSGAIRVSSGVIVACGHIITVESEDIAVTTGAELIVRIDTTDDTASFVARDTIDLTQENLFDDGFIYEVQLATYTILGSSVSSVTKTLGKSSPRNNITTGSTEPTNPSAGDIWFVTS